MYFIHLFGRIVVYYAIALLHSIRLCFFPFCSDTFNEQPIEKTGRRTEARMNLDRKHTLFLTQ